MEKLINLVRRNFWLKVSAVFFAILMWGFIIAQENPIRVKEFSINISLSNYETAMRENNRKILGDLNAIFQPVTVTFRGPLNELSKLKKENIVVEPDFSKVIGPDDNFELPYLVRGYSLGLEVTLSQEYVTVEIDDVKTRTISVDVVLTGELGADYWMGEPEFEKTITIKGASKHVEKVQKAVCTINRGKLVKSINESYLVELQDADGNIVPSDLFEDEIPSQIISLEVFPKKTVSVSEAVVGEIKEGFEIVGNVDVKPGTVTIYGDAELIRGITAIKTETIDITDAETNISLKRKLILPEGVYVVGDVSEADVNIRISEKRTTKTFENIKVSVINADGIRHSLSVESADITITGTLSAMRTLKVSDIKLFVDLLPFQGSPGEHIAPIEFELPSELMSLKDVVIDPSNITVIIS